RLNSARSLGLVPSRTGELIADGDSGASLIVLPLVVDIEGTGRDQLRHLAAFLAWPEGESLRLEPLNGGDDLVVPVGSSDFVSASPDGSEMYIRGSSRAVLVDVEAVEVVAE